MKALFKWFKRTKCRIDEEWCGAFVGRRWCSTHRVRWDGGGPCPRRAEAPRVRV